MTWCLSSQSVQQELRGKSWLFIVWPVIERLLGMIQLKLKIMLRVVMYLSSTPPL